MIASSILAFGWRGRTSAMIASSFRFSTSSPAVLKSRSRILSVERASSPSMMWGWMYGSYPSVVSGAVSRGMRLTMSAIALMEFTMMFFALPG